MVFYSTTSSFIKSSFDKTKYIFDQSIWECNGYFDHWFSNSEGFFVWHMEFVQGETSFDLAAPSINAWSMLGRDAMAAHS